MHKIQLLSSSIQIFYDGKTIGTNCINIRSSNPKINKTILSNIMNTFMHYFLHSSISNIRSHVLKPKFTKRSFKISDTKKSVCYKHIIYNKKIRSFYVQFKNIDDKNRFIQMLQGKQKLDEDKVSTNSVNPSDKNNETSDKE